jgi:hypothetical protein
MFGLFPGHSHTSTSWLWRWFITACLLNLFHTVRNIISRSATCTVVSRPLFILLFSHQRSTPSNKLKLKLSHYTPWRRLGERRYSSYSFSTSALDGSEWSASRIGRALAPVKGPPRTHCTGGWVGPRAGLDKEALGKILCPCRRSNLDRPVVQPVARHCTDWAIRLTPSNKYVYKNSCLMYFLYWT